MGKKGNIVSVRAELSRLQALYEGQISANRDLQAQLIELVKARESAAEMVEKLLAGVKGIVNPDLAPPESNDIYTVVEPKPADQAKDPAFEISPDDWDWSDAMKETLKREEAEDAV